MLKRKYIFIVIFIVVCSSSKAQTHSSIYNEQHRPQVHFSPRQNWVNDPNGMVYSNGVYHLFFQHFPDRPVWGPMHWGHATSKDLVHWQEQPIALYPDSLGYIFSGSAVVDKNNTSGFGKNEEPPLVAIFTHHDPVGEKQKRNDYENQSLAYSTDKGKTWIKYAKNPVLKNVGVTDFRDPKVMWYEPQKKWIMTLATKDRVTFFSSPNLKNWVKESEFGKVLGAHGGVWECPDLFTLNDNGKQVWVVIVNINPGGPNGGSATQYFLGNFDGKNFTATDTKTRWLDYGPDEYAGITWSNTGERKIFLGWMSNWKYCNLVPTTAWRNAMTIPRELKLAHSGSDLLVTSEPVNELNKIRAENINLNNLKINKTLDLSAKAGKISFPCRLDLEFEDINDFSVVLSNSNKEEVTIGFDKNQKQFFIDRTHSGKTDFQKDFAARHVAPRFTDNKLMNMSLIIDVSSVELFADGGKTVMTEIFFPNKPFDQMHMQTQHSAVIKKLMYSKLNSIWH